MFSLSLSLSLSLVNTKLCDIRDHSKERERGRELKVHYKYYVNSSRNEEQNNIEKQPLMRQDVLGGMNPLSPPPPQAEP